VWREWERNISARVPGWKVRESNGEETLTWKRNGSFIRTFPPKAAALHGKQSDLVALDEVWDLDTETGIAVTQAVVPTQATRPRRQYWVISTAGTESSIWFRGWVDRARASVGDPDSRIAYFDWSCPDDLDPCDPEAWPLFHPAYGHTINAAAMRDALDQMGPVEFARAYGNQWPTAATSWRAGWPALASEDLIPEAARVFLAADARVDHRAASVAAAGELADGRIGVEIVENRGGVEWLTGRLAELTKRHRCPVSINTAGPLGYLIPALQESGVRVDAITAGDYADAAGKLRTLIADGGITHRDDPRLNSAVEGVETRAAGDRSVWRKRDSAVDETPLVAVSLAVWRAAHPGPRPGIVTA
jgi:hypothetical protein